MSEWRPIETAPEDELVLVTEGRKAFGMHVAVLGLYGPWWFDSLGDSRLKPTHWMPLPKPPTEGDA